MEADIKKSSIILLHGPFFTGKTSLQSYLQLESYDWISPEELFEDNPSYGLRDVALAAIEKLKKSRKVVIDSDSCTTSSRQSYISLIRKKLPNIRISVVEILPQYGCQQLFWAQEYNLAIKASNNCDIKQTQLRDGQIVKWFSSEDDLDVTYRRGIVEAPVENEGVKVHRLKVNLTCETSYKLEVPALLIQWDILQNLCKDDRLSVGALTKVLKLWSSSCPCGRIIIIYDGTALRLGVRNSSQATEGIVSLMKQLTQSFCDVPVYVYAVINPGLAGRFVVPPRPGLIAYLQRRHCLDLQSKCTLYLYESHQHQQMAEKAGLAHLKASRVLEHPSLVTVRHASIIPPIPELLKNMEVKEKTNDQCPGTSIPLFDDVTSFSDGYIKKNLAFGRTEYMFVDDMNVIERYQALYAKKATKVGEEGSKIAADLENQSDVHHKETMEDGPPLNISRVASENRDLPKWMMQKNESNSSVKSSLDLSRSESVSSAEVKIKTMEFPQLRNLKIWIITAFSKDPTVRKCYLIHFKKKVYAMTENELTEVAMDILKQAGRTDLLKQFERREQDSNSRRKCSTSENNTTAHANDSKHKKRNHNKRTPVKSKAKNKGVGDYHARVLDERVSHQSDSENEVNERVNESQVNTSSSLNWAKSPHNFDHSENRLNSGNEDLAEKSDSPEESKTDHKPYCVEEVVTNALDDFLETDKQRTPTPTRKTRLKMEESPAQTPAKRRAKRAIRDELNEIDLTDNKWKLKKQDKTETDTESDDETKSKSDKMFEWSPESPKRRSSRKCLNKTNVGDTKTNDEFSKDGSRHKRPDISILDELFG